MFITKYKSNSESNNVTRINYIIQLVSDLNSILENSGKMNQAIWCNLFDVKNMLENTLEEMTNDR